MNQLDRDCLFDMLRYAVAMEGFLGAADADELAADLKKSLAIAHAMQVVGEAAIRVSNSTRDRLPNVPWADVIGMRHRLVHDYRNTRIQVLFDTVKQDIPVLLRELRRALEDNAQ